MITMQFDAAKALTLRSVLAFSSRNSEIYIVNEQHNTGCLS